MKPRFEYAIIILLLMFYWRMTAAMESDPISEKKSDSSVPTASESNEESSSEVKDKLEPKSSTESAVKENPKTVDSKTEPVNNEAVIQKDEKLNLEKHENLEQQRQPEEKANKIDSEGKPADKAKKEESKEIARLPGLKKKKLPSPSTLHFYAGADLSFLFFGSEATNALKQSTDLFHGASITSREKNFQTTFQMEAGGVERSYTGFVPAVFGGVSYEKSRHRFFLELHFAGLIPLNTVNYESSMTLTETQCSTTCSLSNAGFTGSNGVGQYQTNAVVNEDFLWLNPAIGYEWKSPLQMAGIWYAGVSLGPSILSARQKTEFSASRVDGSSSVLRSLEGYLTSSVASATGLQTKVFVRLDPRLSFTKNIFLRAGFRYSWIPITRVTTGYIAALLDNSVSALIPASGTAFPQEESLVFTSFGFYLQGGYRF